MVVSTSHDVLDVDVELECRLLSNAKSAMHSCSWSMPFRAERGFGIRGTQGRLYAWDAHWTGSGWANGLRQGVAELVLFLLLAMSFKEGGGNTGDGCGCTEGLLSLGGSPLPVLPDTLAHVPALRLAMSGCDRVSGLFNSRCVCVVLLGGALSGFS